MADVTPRHVALFLRHGSWMRAAAFALRCEQNLNTKAGADFLSTLETSARLMRTDLVSAAADGFRRRGYPSMALMWDLLAVTTGV